MSPQDRIDYLVAKTADLVSQLEQLIAFQQRVHQAETVSERPRQGLREGVMKEESTFAPRFVVRKGTNEGSWMVWDRNAGQPAYSSDGQIAAGLTEEQARSVRDELT